MATDKPCPEAADRLNADDYFRGVIDATRVAMGVMDLSGRLEFVNRRAVELLRIAGPEEAVGRPATDFWPEAMRGEMEDGIATAAAGSIARFRGVGPSPEGTPMWWDATLAPIFDEHGEVVRLAAHMHDVTAEIDAGSFLDTIVEQVPTMLFAKDVQTGRFVLVNRVAEEVFGYSSAEMLGKTDYDFFPKEQADFFRQRDAEVVRSGQVHLIEEEPVTTAGGLRWFRTRKAATYGPDGPRYMVVVAEDITERKRAEEALKAALISAEAASRAKSEFLSNMSHELRTPLNGVVGMADLLAGAPLSARHREMLEVIRESGRSLERVLSDVLDVAEIDAGRVEIRSEDFDLGDLVQGLAAVFETRARDKELGLRLSTAAVVGCRVKGDAVRLKQVLSSLLENAVKFTEQGEVTFSAESAGGATWRFTVSDTGIGFDPVDKASLFGRFQQADGSITRRFGGAGLGLAIAGELAERMGGSIECDSTPGRGSSFVLTIPLGESLSAAPGREFVSAAAEVGEHTALKVLLVDDSAANRTVLKLILAQIDADIATAENGEQACAMFESERFDIVLMDMQMPVMDGLAATRGIREIEGRRAGARTPVLMVTANALPDHAQASLAAGADRHLPKPIQPAILFRSIEEVLAGAVPHTDNASRGER